MAQRVPIGDRLERAIESRVELDAELARAEAQERAEGPSTRRKVIRSAIWLGITGVSLYLVAPSLIDVFGSADELGQIDPRWFIAMAALQAGVLFCLWWLQRIALHDAAWRPVIASQLAGNALAKVVPGGGAVGAALQYKLLVRAGVDRARAVAGITAANVLMFAVVLALPLLAVPAIIRGFVDRELVVITIFGLLAFAVLLTIGTVAATRDGFLGSIGRGIQRLRNRIRPRSEPLHELPVRLLRERDRLLSVLGRRWKAALAAGILRWLLEFAVLEAALAAVGSHPRPGAVLLAFCAAQVLAQIPATPGGLGFVEAGLTATLALAGVHAGDAVLATLAYRLFTYWLPLPLGLVGLWLQPRAALP